MHHARIREIASTMLRTVSKLNDEQRSWLYEGRMSDSQRRRLGTDQRPPCFTSDEQWISWCIAETSDRIPHSGYCYDCRARFKKRMLDEGRCTYPLTIFRRAANSTLAVIGERREEEVCD